MNEALYRKAMNEAKSARYDSELDNAFFAMADACNWSDEFTQKQYNAVHGARLIGTADIHSNALQFIELYKHVMPDYTIKHSDGETYGVTMSDVSCSVAMFLESGYTDIQVIKN